MNPHQSAEERILLTVADQSKLDLVMELLSHFDLVRAKRVKRWPEVELTSGSLTGSEDDFWSLAGAWDNRDIDAQQLKQQVWQRANGSQL